LGEEIPFLCAGGGLVGGHLSPFLILPGDRQCLAMNPDVYVPAPPSSPKPALKMMTSILLDKRPFWVLLGQIELTSIVDTALSTREFRRTG
jgi:hypothetical protein